MQAIFSILAIGMLYVIPAAYALAYPESNFWKYVIWAGGWLFGVIATGNFLLRRQRPPKKT